MPALRMTMRLWIGMVVLLMLGCSVRRMHAQAMTTASGGGSYVSVGGGMTAMQTQYGRRVIAGGMAYTESNITPRVGLEYEGRFLRLNTSESVTQSSYLAGLRITTRDRRVQPYVKVLAGLGRMTFPFHYATGSYFVVAPGAGVDYHLGGRWTLRLVDVEYQDWIAFSYGGLQPYGVSSGVRFRVSGVELFPKKMRHRH